jgi:cysteine desulfurase
MLGAPIYLDHNATTPIDPRVVEAMTRAWRDCGANPASQHASGRKARRVLEESREGIAELLGAKTGGMDADRVIFTSGGTEANNLALCGLLASTIGGSKPVPDVPLIVSSIEHPSISTMAAYFEARGTTVRRHPVAGSGIVSTNDDLAAALVSIMLANNETGVTQPVETLAAKAHTQGSLVHTDAVQAVGKIRVHFGELGVDAMTVAPHKFHGPLGIGALVLKHGVKLQPQLHGGFQQEGLRPGTENVALAVGYHRALELAVSELPERESRMRSLRDELERLIRAPILDTVIIGEDAPRLPNTSCISFPGVDRQALVMALDLAAVACSTGSACASGSSEPSPTLLAMGLPKAVVDGAIRLSLGAFTTAPEVAEAARRILKAVNHLRSQKSH